MMADSFVKYLNSVIGGTSACFGLVADQPRVTETPGIHAILVKVIFNPAFACKFGYTVHRIRFHNGILRSVIMGSSGAEYSYGTGPEDSFKFDFAGDLKYVEEAAHIDVP